MPSLPPQTTKIIGLLQGQTIEPILYGSQGVSLYIGAFKEFGDVDLLVDERFLKEDWQLLQETMRRLSFELKDEREHEFANNEGMTVAFASSDILRRDGISQSIGEAVCNWQVNGTSIRTLTPEAFLKAYQFSQQNGYRKNVRGKKDAEVIQLIQEYLDNNQI